MTSNDHRGRPPDYVHAEPEIIPPGRGERRNPTSQVWVWVADRDGTHRAAITPPGPLTIFLILALVALIVALILAVFLGAVLFWIPVLVVLLGAGLLAAAVRQRWRQFQHWLSRR